MFKRMNNKVIFYKQIKEVRGKVKVNTALLIYKAGS